MGKCFFKSQFICLGGLGNTLETEVISGHTKDSCTREAVKFRTSLSGGERVLQLVDLIMWKCSKDAWMNHGKGQDHDKIVRGTLPCKENTMLSLQGEKVCAEDGFG